MSTSFSRRTFLRTTSLAAAGAGLVIPRLASQTPSANNKLNIAVIGVANQGAYNLGNVAHENIVALCDVDDTFLSAAAQKHPGAKTYNDYRRLIDQKGIDAILVATPDHTHAVATVAALKSGRHGYCEKPLTHTISECRAVREAAIKNKRITQIGTQIHAGSNYRRVVELVKSNVIGPISEVHVWVASSYGNMERPLDTPAIPAGLHYDLWLGPVPERPYHPSHVPFKWRNWWAYGGGSLGDFGCHFMDLPHWALDLREPISAEAEGPTPHPESTPGWMIVRYEYPERKKLPSVKLTWYHGGKQPPMLTPEQAAKWKSGVLFVGEKGQIFSDYGSHALLPEKDWVGFQAPAPFIAESIGHHKEWILSCKTGQPTTCNFDYSGALTEAALLGNVAFRVGKKINWDTKHLKAIGCPEADEFIQHHYRKGWKLA